MKNIDKLIINSPYEEPGQYWEYIRDTREFVLQEGRRPAGYVVASESSRAFDDPGVFIPIELVNTIRPRIKTWREEGYPGVTGVTKRLLQHWQDPEERKDRRFFFCQLEAIETLIWLTEAPEADRTGIDIPGDGGAFSRWCSKMATGSGKTIIMAMLIAWQVLNKVANGKDTRFSKNVLVVAPGLTVKSRLSVLNPFDEENYYEEFNIVPSGLMESLRQGKVKIINWHALAWDTEERLAKKKSVDKRGAKSDEAYVRDDLIKNAYQLLAKDWKAAYDSWRERGHKVPPVMITVANTTYTSARIKYSFDHDTFLLYLVGAPELNDTDKTLQIDSSILEKAEAETEEIEIAAEEQPSEEDGDSPKEKKLTRKQQAELLRKTVDTVGRIGEPGQDIQNVISVGMLSEGWDAKTVTHIMGLRAFSSQLLCEQVVGRGLRRTSYDVGKDGLFEPEYVNIFGVPFTFLPHEGGTDGPPPPPPPPKTRIEPVKEKSPYEISFPNILRIDHTYKPRLTLDLAKVKTLELDPYESITEASLAAIIAGKPNPAALTEIDLNEIGEKFRLQSVIFRIASQIYNSEKKPDWKGSSEAFLIQLIGIIEQFIHSGKISIKNPLFNQDEARKRILIMLNMNKIIQHIWNEIRAENTMEITPVFDKEHPIRSTADVRTWWTSKPCEAFPKSHINFTVVDSKWEYLEAKTINDNESVKSFVRNDHLGFTIYYNHQGVVRRYFPDFIVKKKNGDHLIIETKGQDKEIDKTKRTFLDEWCKAVNEHGGFGKWRCAVSFDPNDLERLL